MITGSVSCRRAPSPHSHARRPDPTYRAVAVRRVIARLDISIIKSLSAAFQPFLLYAMFIAYALIHCPLRSARPAGAGEERPEFRCESSCRIPHQVARPVDPCSSGCVRPWRVLRASRQQQRQRPSVRSRESFSSSPIGRISHGKVSTPARPRSQRPRLSRSYCCTSCLQRLGHVFMAQQQPG